ncbi:protein-disulfide reductase DsbD [Legionella sp. W05-934-2]|uniref:protein-disulfide reductase DsbD n=1 Tax=Legionella sp. W05-934-2 TaxID=1198649 RepID=UPI003461F2DA
MPKILLFLLMSILSINTIASPLPAEEAFSLSTQVQSPNTIRVTFHIKPGYFIYKNRLTLKESSPERFTIQNTHYPKSELKRDAQGKKIAIYRQIINLPVIIQATTQGIAQLQVNYQGCSDEGFCYPPQHHMVNLAFNENRQLIHSQLINPITNKIDKAILLISQDKAVEKLFTERHPFTVLLLFFGFGLLLSLTPCVLPMIPVLSSIIVGQGQTVTMRRAFLVSLSYVLSMALTYALVGALVALLGSNLQLIMQSNWAITLFSLVFVLLALAMFGFYDLTLPPSWQAKLANVQRRQQGGHYLGAAIMGCLSTLILSPCVTAPLLGALGYIAQTGKVVFASLALFFLGLGMGTPLLIIGTAAGRYLPKAGQWMNLVKSFFGILLLALAIYLSSRILSEFMTMLLWAALLIFSGLYVGGILPNQQRGKRSFQTLGILLFMYGFLILIGASMGADDPMKPLTKLAAPKASSNIHNNRHVVYSQLALTEAIEKAHGKPVFIDFYADWCASCKAMEKGVLNKGAIEKALSDYVVIKADVTRLNDEQKAMLKYFQVIAPPTFIFLDKQGHELIEHRLIGEQSEESLSQHLQSVAQ